MRRKLGLHEAPGSDPALVDDLLRMMADSGTDFTLTFRRLCDAGDPGTGSTVFATQFADKAAIGEWLTRWRRQLAEQAISSEKRSATMRAANPAYIPRNHRIEKVIEAALAADFQPFEKLMQVLATPFEDQPEYDQYSNPPRPDQIVPATYCGT